MIPSPASPLDRRRFLQTIAAASAAGALGTRLSAQIPTDVLAAPKPTNLALVTNLKIKLGMDNFAVRAMGWKAPQLLDYAASLKLDTLLISDLDAYDSLDDAHLREVKAKGRRARRSKSTPARGASARLRSASKRPGAPPRNICASGIRVAKTLGSPVFRVILGGGRRSQDGRRHSRAHRRHREGAEGVRKDGEGRRREDRGRESRGRHALVGTRRSHRGRGQGFRRREHRLRATARGRSKTRMDVLEHLGPYTICSSLRDDMIWETPDGATIAWTAAGEGLIDWKKYAARWAAALPDGADHDRDDLRLLAQLPLQERTSSGSTTTSGPTRWRTSKRWRNAATRSRISKRPTARTKSRPSRNSKKANWSARSSICASKSGSG